jgi:hypothetical protein
MMQLAPERAGRVGRRPQTAENAFFLRILGLAFHHPIR